MLVFSLKLEFHVAIYRRGRATYFNNDFFYNISLYNISVNIVPWRDIIYILSDIVLGVWRHIFSLATYFRHVLSPRGRAA